MARWEDAMFEQTRQLRFLDSELGKRYMASFERAMRDKQYEDDKFHELPLGVVWQFARQTLEQADPIYVSHNVVEMIDYARDSFQPEIVLPNDPICPAGFAYMARSLSVLDAHGKRTPVRAVGWVPVRAQDEDGMEKGGVWVTFWSHKDDETPEYSDYESTGQSIFARNPHATLTALHSFFLGFNDPMWKRIGETPYQEASVRQWTTIQVMWRLGQQLVRTNQRIPRPARREAKRLGQRQEEITVITLRRASDHKFEAEGDGAGFDFQFLVRGHWRNQWYPSLNEHRQKWINPYVKGDPDGPLRLTKRVYEFVR